MADLTLNRSRLKLLKYIFLSAGCCILFAIVITLYLKSTADQEQEESFGKQKKNKLSKNYNLNINKTIFEGLTSDMNPYRIFAEKVSKGQDNQYNLQTINANCEINQMNIHAKSISGLMDEGARLITLKEDVKITLDNTLVNCEEIELNIENNEAKSDKNVEVNFKNSNITADSFSVDRNKQMVTFLGSVTVTFDNLLLTTSKLIVFYQDGKDKGMDIKEIVVPQSLKAIHHITKEVITADRGVFDNLTKKLTLLGNVHAQKEDNILITDKLIYSSALKDE